jgi:hypothetical protein
MVITGIGLAVIRLPCLYRFLADGLLSGQIGATQALPSKGKPRETHLQRQRLQQE